MKLALFLAKRIATQQQKSFSKFIIRLSIIATSISVMAMIISLSFVNGFQKTISEKVFGFWGHIRVQHFEVDKSLVSEETPIQKNDTVYQILKATPNINKIQAFATKAVVIEKNKSIEGVLFKGVENKYDSTCIKNMFIAGRWLQYNDSNYCKEIVVSNFIATTLNIQLQDIVKVVFVNTENGTATYRPLTVVGIYKTGIEEYDKQFVLGDIALIRKLSGWSNNEIGGYEIFLNDYHQLDAVNNQIELPGIWSSRTIKQVFPNIFDWLAILNDNRNVIFIIMTIVAIINLITCLLILVLERTKMVGILKAIGSSNNLIQQIFLYHATLITLIGIGLGTFLGVGFCYFQQFTGLIKLDESNYYVSVAPIEIVGWQIIVVALGAAIVCFLSLLIPTLFIKKIKPVQAIQFK